MEFQDHNEPEILENIAYILIETVNRNTSGNSGREIVSFLLNEAHLASIFARIEKNDPFFIRINVEILRSLVQFCVMEETRNNYKSPFVNNEAENGCERLCKAFLAKFEEKIADFIDFLQKNDENCTLNTSWRQKITVFGLEKLEIIGLFNDVLKFRSDHLLLKMVENDVFAKLFVILAIFGLIYSLK